MPISFSCGQCGKDYVVSDGLAGKRAVCKACGNRMTIPGDAVTTAAPAPETQASRPRPASASASRPAPAYQPPAGDVYGFDEAPSALPPLMPRTSSPAAEEAADSPVPKKKKQKGFFSTSGKKSSGSSFQFTGIGAGGIKAVVIIGVIIAGILGKMGLSSKTDLRKLYDSLIFQVNDAAITLQTVRDQQTAKMASPKIKSQIAGITKLLESNRNTKGRINEIKELEGEYQQRIEGAFGNLFTQISRCRMIPGALVSLDIEGDLLRMAQVLEELGKNGTK